MKFWDAFKNSTILQAVLTIMIWAAVIYLIVMNQPVPELLGSGAVLTLGFYFGAKVQQAQFNQTQTGRG